MTFVLQNIVDAISLGALYALTALGIGLIFGIMRLINFAHGELIMLGAYALFFTFGMHEAIMGLVAIALVIATAVVMERVAFRPLRRANPATLLIASFALAYFLQHLVLLIFGARPKSVTFLHELSGFFIVEGLRIPKLQVVTIAITIVLLVGLVVFFRRSSIGTQMRAAAEDFGMARLVGVRANSVIAIAFLLSGVLAGIISLLYVVQTGTLTPRMGVSLVLVAFVATVIGGMGSLVGAAVGGLVVGVLTVALQAVLTVELRPYRDAFVFAVLIGFLLVRPQGLLRGRSARERI